MIGPRPLAPGPRVIFFDAGGTLIRLRLSVGEMYAARAAEFGAAADAAQLEGGFQRAFAAAPPLAFPGVADDEIEACEQNWWRAVVRQAMRGIEIAEFEAYFQDLYRDFARPQAWEVFDDVLPALTRLRARGFELGVISNFDRRLLPIFRGLELSPFFDSITVSSTAGYAKPDARVFTRALRLHGVEPGDALHVGDSRADDIEGARAAGLGAVQVRTDGAPGLQDALDAALAR